MRLAKARTLERDILEAANRERQRIGCDLHDGVGQELTGLAFMLGSTRRRRFISSTRKPRRSVDEISGLLKRSIDSVRSLAKGMLPVTAQEGGLAGSAAQLRGAQRRSVWHAGCSSAPRCDRGSP